MFFFLYLSEIEYYILRKNRKCLVRTCGSGLCKLYKTRIKCHGYRFATISLSTGGFRSRKLWCARSPPGHIII